ncbi:MAG: lipopolysaccharide biosynthesis protein RfbH [Candidatus Rokubacteria bacterium]|nr:lipopolysaccharide biosynthesis protein RfbH [Candidatus Rokubacteria bacterium]
MSPRGDELRDRILALVREYAVEVHTPKAFVPGESKVPYAGRVFDDRELQSLVGSALDFWLTAGPYAAEFEKGMRKFFGSVAFLLVNSGSSANLTMVSALTSSMVERPLRPGDEVITPAVTFPTTLTPIVQNGLVPVFVDCEIGTYNADPKAIEAAVGPRTRALMLPHTLGNPFDLTTATRLATQHDLYLLEDCCDALGSTFDGRRVGTFGHMASLSFYPAHHMTMGEGGGVVVNTGGLVRAAESIRDWGRDCWCPPGQANTCGKRYEWQLGDLPTGYDHKYIYSNLGYNLKATDLQAAIGVAQLAKVPEFCARRRENFRRLYEGLRRWEDRLVLPRWLPQADPAWFGFPVTVRDGVSRLDFVRFLDERKIETRMIFAGNVLRQPGFRGIPHRVAGELTASDTVMNDTFFLGVYPGLTPPMIDYVVESVAAFFAR